MNTGNNRRLRSSDKRNDMGVSSGKGHLQAIGQLEGSWRLSGK